MKVALLPGGFKPPHLGHYNMAKYLADFADNVIVRIGSKEREGIGPELALEIFNYYKASDPDPRAQKLTISLAQAASPVRDVYDFIEQEAPEGSILRSESAFQLLNRVKKVATEWVKTGHRSGSNTHNVSATISLKDEDWELAGDWMWKNRDHYNGLAVLPYDGGTYTQAPFEDITKKKYNEMVKSLMDIDLSKITEENHETNLTGELACAGGACEVK